MAAILFSLLFYISIPIFISIYALLYFLRFILYFFNIQNGRHSKMAAILKNSNSNEASSHWGLFLCKVSLRFLKRCSRNASDNEKAGRKITSGNCDCKQVAEIPKRPPYLSMRFKIFLEFLEFFWIFLFWRPFWIQNGRRKNSKWPSLCSNIFLEFFIFFKFFRFFLFWRPF